MMANRKNFAGMRFGRLLAVSFHHMNKDGRAEWLFYCDCGNSKVMSPHNASKILRIGKQKSNGCGQCQFDHRFPKEYAAWSGMKQRCFNANEESYKDYGGRGITVYPGWIHDFSAFYNYIGSAPSLDYSVDRINTNGNYEPGNVKWSTSYEQVHNRRSYDKDMTYARNA